MRRIGVRLLLVAILSAAAVAQGEPMFVVPWATGDPGSRIAAGDLNGDGLGDVAFSSEHRKQLPIRLGRRDASLAPAVTLDVGGPSYVVFFADMDGDGVLDVLDGNYAQSGPQLLVFLGAGDGSFGAAVVTPVPQGIESASLADFDLDGNLDVLAVSSGATVLLNQGGGALAPSAVLPLGFMGAGAAGDLTADGVPDLLISETYELILRVWSGDGQGSFTPLPLLHLGELSAFPVLTDADADGELDLLSSSQAGMELRLNLGPARFAAPLLQPLALGTSPALVADLDEDGVEDVVGTPYTGYGDNRNLAVGLCDGLGGYDPAQWLALPLSFGPIVAADMNGDGDLDLVGPPGDNPLFVPQPPRVDIARGLGNGLFANWSGIDAIYGYLQRIVVADLDHDGRDDVVLVHEGASHVLLAHESGALAAVGPDLQEFGDPVVLDANGDGDLDLVSTGGDMLRTSLGDGAGAFGQPIESTVAKTLAASGDIDGDGDIDILSDGKPVAYFYYSHLSQGDGTWKKVVTSIGDVVAQEHVLADLDGDGTVDLVRVFSSGYADLGGLHVHAGQGDGVFAPAAVAQPELFLTQLRAFDPDADGDLDLIGFGVPEKQLEVVLNDGAGGFAAPPVESDTGSPAPTTFVLADFTGDGQLDACVATSYYTVPADEQHGRVLAGQPDGSFVEEAEFGPTLDVVLATGDFDGDGWPDLVHPAEGNCALVLLNQHGPWNEHGNALAGAQGRPRQIGTGHATPGAPISVALHDGARLSPTFQVLGFSAGFMPFRGGVLVPQPDLVNGPQLTDAAGDLVLSGSVPASLPAGATVWMQTWLIDAAGPEGWSASNGLSLSLP